MKYILVKLKMILEKKHEQTMKHLQFKLDPFPADSAEVCLFHESYMKIFGHLKS
jgi:hypothetical protein